MEDIKIVIIGAGVSGLIAAKTLEEKGFSPIIIDKGNQPGGRIISENKDGCQLDKGFQVLLTAYPEAKKHLNYDRLNLRYFKPGAIIFNKGKSDRIGDPLRDFSALFPTIKSSFASASDKLKIWLLSTKLKNKSIEDIFSNRTPKSTMQYLKDYGFSQQVIDSFFQPFFSGIFLETELRTPSSMFEFVFKMFSMGRAAIPAAGIGEISNQLSSGLKKTEIKLNSKVVAIKDTEIHFENGDIEKFDAIITTYATEENTLWKGCLNLYFEIQTSNLPEALIGLMPKDCITNNINIHKSNGSNLLSVTVIESKGLSDTDLINTVKKELETHCNITVGKCVGTYKIPQSLPDNKALKSDADLSHFRIKKGVYRAGDYLLNSSLNAAMLSGERAAEALVEDFKS